MSPQFHMVVEEGMQTKPGQQTESRGKACHD